MSTFGGRVFVAMDTSDGNFYIYTDASAPVRKEHAGIGIYFGHGHPLTGFKELKAGIKSGDAEVFAATEALSRLWDWEEGYSRDDGEIVVLRTDCLSMIEKMEKIIARRTVRKPQEGKSFDNGVRRLIQLAEKFPKGVRFEYVRAGSKDEGIQAADRLATRASYGLTAVNRGHNHSHSHQVATRPQRNFFHPESFRVGKTFHVEHNLYARADEFFDRLQRCGLTDSSSTQQEKPDPATENKAPDQATEEGRPDSGFDSGDEDLDSTGARKLSKRKADEPEDAPASKKPRSTGAIRLGVSRYEAKRLQAAWNATLKSLPDPTPSRLSTGNRDEGHILPHKTRNKNLHKPRNKADSSSLYAKGSFQSQAGFAGPPRSFGKRNFSKVIFNGKLRKAGGMSMVRDFVKSHECEDQ